MSVNFSEAKCKYTTEKKLFGLCDDPPPPPKQAYIDEENGEKWIAVVVNDDRQRVTFTAIDNCIEIKSKNGRMAKRCDGVLTVGSTEEINGSKMPRSNFDQPLVALRRQKKPKITK